jgi:hypothetical protein
MNVFSNMIYAWRDYKVHFIFKWTLYSFTRVNVVARLSFEHVEQLDSIQSSGWTRISVQLSGLNKIFCSNPRNLYVTSSVSSSSSCSTQGLNWRVCSTRESSLNFCSKLNSTNRLTRACATTSSKSKEKSEDDAQSTRLEDFWLFEKLDHQNSCSIKNLQSSARAEKNQ